MNDFNDDGQKHGYWEEPVQHCIWKGFYLNGWKEGYWYEYGRDGFLRSKWLCEKYSKYIPMIHYSLEDIQYAWDLDIIHQEEY